MTKFVSGCMASLSAMVQLELPHVNILSKMDLVTNKRDIEKLVLFSLQNFFVYLAWGRSTRLSCLIFSINIGLFFSQLLESRTSDTVG